MSPVPSIEITVVPDDCDSFAHVSQAAVIRLFERTRWEALRLGPGMDVFSRNNPWPAVRKATIEYYHQAFPGDILRFDTALTQQGRTGFTLHQLARRVSDNVMITEADLVFVCIDRDGRPAEVPAEAQRFFGTRPSVRAASIQRVLVDGLATAVDMQGDGPAILFIHGFPLDRTMWRQLMAPMTGWRRIAPDLRGFGLSEAPDGNHGLGAYADDLIALLDQLGEEQAVVCGLSMGGYIAFDLMRRFPHRVRGLILANPRAEADSPDAKRGRDETIELVERDGVEALVPLLLPKLLAPVSQSTLPQVVEHVRTMIASSPAAGVMAALRAMKNRPDSSSLLAEIQVPTLVIAGRDDQLIPVTESRKMVDRIPNARFTVIPDAGHLTPLEQPIATGRVVGEFLAALS